MVCVDDARRSKRHMSIISMPSSSGSSPAYIGAIGPTSRSRRKCGVNNIRTMLLFLMLGTAVSVFTCWEIMLIMMNSKEQVHTSTNGIGQVNNYYNGIGANMSFGGTKSEEGRRRNAIDASEAIPPGLVELPSYTRDMALDAVRPAPWTCGSGSSDNVSNQRFGNENGIKSSATSSSSIGDERHIFSFVHVYKSAGSTIRTFFRQYSYICQKSWMLLVSCDDRRNASPQSSISIRALKDGKGEGVYWKGCKIKEMDFRPHDLINDNSTLREDSIDIYAGHFRIGIVGTIDNETTFGDGGDASSYYPWDHHASTKQQSSPLPSSAVVVRHIVFLRDPMSRFVSGILYQHQRSAQFDGTLDGAVQRIKKNVRGSRKKQEYWIRSLKYLLTTSQASYFSKTRSEIMGGNNNATTLEEKMSSMADIESRTAIQNLVKYNVIVGLAERMDQSMTILRQVLMPATNPAAIAADTASSQEQDDKIDALFNVFGGSSSRTGVVPGKNDVDDDKEREFKKEEIRMNASGQEGVSTKMVLEELMKDMNFLPVFIEYVKYEQRIHDFALEMHELQYKEALGVG